MLARADEEAPLLVRFGHRIVADGVIEAHERIAVECLTIKHWFGQGLPGHDGKPTATRWSSMPASDPTLRLPS